MTQKTSVPRLKAEEIETIIAVLVQKSWMTFKGLILMQNIKYSPRFIGLIMLFILPGAAHVFSGHWKAGAAWFGGFYIVFGFCLFILCLPITLSFLTIVAAELLFVVYLASLFISSYRPTRQLGCSGWTMFILFVVAFNIIVNKPIMYLVAPYIGEFAYGKGYSMDPTIYAAPSSCRDVIAVNKFLYRSGTPCRGDVVSFFMWNDGAKVYILKRVVGLPGETVEFRSPYVVINGKELFAPPIFEKISSCKDGYSGYDAGGMEFPITLGPNEYFLLGDNPSESGDSRTFGPVLRENILGKAMRIIFPPSRIREL